MMTITGIMRSATSLAAVTANQSGILMGSSMVIPYGGLTEEYEDLELAIPLTQAVFGGVPLDADRVFGEYVHKRQAEHEGAQKIMHRPAWGFKSPLLMLYWESWRKATAGLPEVVVVTSRCLAESMQSLKRASGLAKGEFGTNLLGKFRSVERDLFAARKEIATDADYVVSYDALREDPVSAMSGAIRAVGV